MQKKLNNFQRSFFIDENSIFTITCVIDFDNNKAIDIENGNVYEMVKRDEKGRIINSTEKFVFNVIMDGEIMNEMIKEGKNKEERFEILSQIAKYQLNILNNAEKIKLLGDSKEYEGQV